NPLNWHLHFNFDRNRGDWDRVMRGDPLVQKPEMREVCLSNYKRDALAGIWTNNCNRATHSFGMGLHCIQDLFSHGPFTPLDHRDVANANFIDNPEFSLGDLIGVRQCKFDKPGLDRLFPNAKCRIFKWVRSRHRIMLTEQRTRAEIDWFLGVARES